MTTATQHASTLLSAIIPKRTDLLDAALQRITSEHVQDHTMRTMLTLTERYYEATGGIITRTALTDILERSNVNPSNIILYEQVYDNLANTEVTDAEARWAIDGLLDHRAQERTAAALADAMEVLRGTRQTDGKQSSHKEARDLLLTRIADIDAELRRQNTPEGNMLTEAQDILKDYADRKAGKTVNTVMTGIAPLDVITSGHQRGELILYVGYAGEGKTTIVSQLAWHAATQQGKHVYFATTETLRAQVRRKIVARHSRLPQFNLPQGLDSHLIKDGALTPDKEEVLKSVVADLQQNPTYGKLHLAQVERASTITSLEARFQRYCQRQDKPVDILIIDYLALLRADRRSQNNQEKGDIINDAKGIAVTCMDGLGVPVVSPWHVGQDKYKTALTRGEYVLGDLAETSQAEKTVDLIVSLLGLPETPGELKCQTLKNRDGEKAEPFTLSVDYATSTITPKTSSSAIDSLIE